MNKQELIKRIEVLPYTEGPIADTITINRNWILESIKQLDEPETGHADEAPRYVKNILARLRELPLHNREVWLKAIMGEFEQDFSHAKWREGYEQGKLEGAWVGNQLKDADKIRQELNKPAIPQFVANWIEEARETTYNIRGAIEMAPNGRVKDWLELKNVNIFAEAWVNGYEVEEENQYVVTLKNRHPLVKSQSGSILYFSQDITAGNYKVTRKELEEAGFGWVFDCEGIEIEEVEHEN